MKALLILIATYDRTEVVVCGVIAILIATGYGVTRRDTSEFADCQRQLSRAEKVMVWAIVGMLVALLGAAVSLR